MKMKKIVTYFLMAILVLVSANTAFAADEMEKITKLEDGTEADVTGIRRMALAEPQYNQMKDGPSLLDVSQAIYDASSLTKRYVVSYSDIAANIKRDTDVDIRPLNRRQAMKVFRLCVPKYVDAYIDVTVANNNRKTIFVDVFQCKTDAVLYRYQLTADKNAEDSYITYRALAEQFFKKFDRAIENQKKRHAVEAERKAKLNELLSDPKKRAEYEAKTERDKQREMARLEKREAAEKKAQAKVAADEQKSQMKAQDRAEKKRRKGEMKAAKNAKKEQERFEKAEKKAAAKAEKARTRN